MIMEDVSVIDPSSIFLDAHGRAAAGSTARNAPLGLGTGSQKTTISKVLASRLEPPDPVTGEVKAIWDGPLPPPPEAVFFPEGSLRVDILPDSHLISARYDRLATGMPPRGT